MAEYIEREALLTEIAELHMKHKLADNEEMMFSESDIRGLVLCLPTAEVEPVRHTTFKDGECMACGWFGDCVDTPHYNYCPGCGARADGGADHA